MGCNYLSLPLISASGTLVLINVADWNINHEKTSSFYYSNKIVLWASVHNLCDTFDNFQMACIFCQDIHHINLSNWSNTQQFCQHKGAWKQYIKVFSVESINVESDIGTYHLSVWDRKLSKTILRINIFLWCNRFDHMNHDKAYVYHFHHFELSLEALYHISGSLETQQQICVSFTTAQS